jgi:hypothetical protein
METNQPSRRRAWLFRAIVGGLVLFVCAGAVLGWELYRIETGMQLPFRVSGSWIARDPQLGYVPRPNNQVEFYHPDSDTRYQAFTDRLGARVSARGEQSPLQADLLFVGCSFTWGLGVKNEDTYAVQVGRMLGVPSVNLAMGGYGSIQSLLRLRANVGLQPKVVVYGFLETHLERNLSPCAAAPPAFCLTQPFFEDGADGGHIHPPFAPLEGFEAVHIMVHDWHGPGDVLRAATWALRTDLFHLTTRAEGSDEAMSKSIRYAIAEMAQATRAIGAPLLVVYIPMLVERPADPPEALRRAVAESRVGLLDLAPAVREHYRVRPRVPLVMSPVDAHPNAEGHLLIAERIAQALSGS